MIYKLEYLGFVIGFLDPLPIFGFDVLTKIDIYKKNVIRNNVLRNQLLALRRQPVHDEHSVGPGHTLRSAESLSPSPSQL